MRVFSFCYLHDVFFCLSFGWQTNKCTKNEGMKRQWNNRLVKKKQKKTGKRGEGERWTDEASWKHAAYSFFFAAWWYTAAFKSLAMLPQSASRLPVALRIPKRRGWEDAWRPKTKIKVLTVDDFSGLLNVNSFNGVSDSQLDILEHLAHVGDVGRLHRVLQSLAVLLGAEPRQVDIAHFIVSQHHGDLKRRVNKKPRQKCAYHHGGRELVNEEVILVRSHLIRKW